MHFMLEDFPRSLSHLLFMQFFSDLSQILEEFSEDSRKISWEVFRKSSEVFCLKWYKGMMSSGVQAYLY
ncbi:hypothetical protein Bca4012_010119 [Brassica carinata]